MLMLGPSQIPSSALLRGLTSKSPATFALHWFLNHFWNAFFLICIALCVFLPQVKEAMLRRGVLLSTDGPFENVLKMKPPLVFNKDNADEVVDKLDLVITELTASAWGDSLSFTHQSMQKTIVWCKLLSWRMWLCADCLEKDFVD